MIEDFAASRGAEVLARFTEVESGRKVDRPELPKALHLAKVAGATLVIAKLDRFSRNAAFLLALRDSGVRFVAVDMPEANDLTVRIMALATQAARDAILRRTKEALADIRAAGHTSLLAFAEALTRRGDQVAERREAGREEIEDHAEEVERSVSGKERARERVDPHRRSRKVGRPSRCLIKRGGVKRTAHRAIATKTSFTAKVLAASSIINSR